MAWCRQATSHYLSQCWPRSMSPYGVIRPQVRQQAITWANVDPDLCPHMASLGHNDLKSSPQWWSCECHMLFYVLVLWYCIYLCKYPTITSVITCSTFLYARLKNGRIMLWQCPSICPSVRPSVRPSEFSGLFFNVLWDINLKLGICIQ